MDRVYDIIQKIKLKPNVYLGRPSIMCLQAFLSGYNVAQYESGKSLNTPYCFDGFQEWIQAKFKVDTSKYWANIILFYSEDERDALERFFYLFKEFVEENVDLSQHAGTIKLSIDPLEYQQQIRG